MQAVIDLFVWLIFYFALLQLSSVAICGWYATTRGSKYKQPDGTEVKTGKLLKAWYFFWHMESPQKIETQYLDAQLHILINKMQPAAHGVPMWIPENVMSHFKTTSAFHKYKAKLEDMFNVRFMMLQIPLQNEETESHFEVRTFEVEPHYLFPSWIRDMMAGCITCHASFYGSVIFWTLYWAVSKNVWLNLYSPFEYHWFGVIFTWLAYTFSLAYLNTVKYRKF